MGTPKGTEPWNKGKGKGWINQQGYRCVSVTRNGRRQKKKYHRHVMEQHIGRTLEPWEVVHHIDGDKLNNELPNLELVEFGAHTFLHHKGARRTREARTSIEAFAQIRAELGHLREINAELYDALDLAFELLSVPEHAQDKEWKERYETIAPVLARARGEAEKP